jgi:mRNA interferase MazF
MMSYERGDVVLLQFPFTTFVRRKQRPAVIVSTNDYNRAGDDVIAAAITSNLKVARRPGDYLLTNWREAGLIKESLVKSVLFTVEKSLIVRKLGRIDKADMEGISEGLREALGLSHAA